MNLSSLSSLTNISAYFGYTCEIRRSMDEDDDGPPMLVAVDGDPVETRLSAEMDNISLLKVPITIITGS